MWRVLSFLAAFGILGLLGPWSQMAALVLGDTTTTELRDNIGPRPAGHRTGYLFLRNDGAGEVARSETNSRP